MWISSRNKFNYKVKITIYVRGIAMSLFYNYEVNEIYGIKYSFKGLFEYGL